MSKTIFKYRLSLTDRQIIEIPMGSKILSIQAQSNYGETRAPFSLWMEIDSDQKSFEPRMFHIVGTGKPIPSTDDDAELVYLATVQIEDGMLVWHFYEEVTKNS